MNDLDYNPTLLIVDDDAGVRALLERLGRRRRAQLMADRDSARRHVLCGMIGRRPRMQELFGLVRRLAPHVRVTLVTGETGTGKELAARALHQLGPRGQRKFITVNCSAVVESLFESELFGHVRGAFRGATEQKQGLFEAADGGTLFLDEVGELPLSLQGKLLRTLDAGEVQRVGSLEPRKVDVHVIAATNRDLDAEVAAGRFRRDLLYRLNVVDVWLPPLRERREDIPLLTASLVMAASARFGKRLDGVTPAAEQALLAHDWPGNVRELRNVVERACMFADGTWLSTGDVLQALPSSLHSVAAPAARGPSPATVDVLCERGEIERVLTVCGGNVAAAARQLGMTRRSLYRRLDRYALHGGRTAPMTTTVQ